VLTLDIMQSVNTCVVLTTVCSPRLVHVAHMYIPVQMFSVHLVMKGFNQLNMIAIHSNDSIVGSYLANSACPIDTSKFYTF
jgi:hypothetical protein